eukprot:sb/3478568/
MSLRPTSSKQDAAPTEYIHTTHVTPCAHFLLPVNDRTIRSGSGPAAGLAILAIVFPTLYQADGSFSGPQMERVLYPRFIIVVLKALGLRPRAISCNRPF